MAKQFLPTTYERCHYNEDPRKDTYIQRSGYLDEYGQHYEKKYCHYCDLDYYTREKLDREYKEKMKI